MQPSVCDKSVRRSAQDDDFVRVLKKNTPNKLALMELRPGLSSASSAVPAGLSLEDGVLTHVPQSRTCDAKD